MDAAAVVLIGLTCLEIVDRSRGASLEAHHRAAVDSLPARAVRPRRRRPASGVSGDDGVGHGCGVARTSRPAAGRGGGVSRVRGHAARGLPRGALRGRHLRAGADREPDAVCRSVRQPAGAIRRRLVRLDCDRRLSMGRALHAPGEHRVLSGAAGADAAGGADHRLARAGRDARPAHAAGAVGRRVHLARVVLRGADLPVAAEPSARRRARRRRRRRCCSPPIRSPCSSTRRTRKGCSCSAPSAPSITSIASSGSRRRCSGCSSA